MTTRYSNPKHRFVKGVAQGLLDLEEGREVSFAAVKKRYLHIIQRHERAEVRVVRLWRSERLLK